jgi:phospholipase D-like protein
MARTKKRWRDLSPMQRARIVIAGSIQITLLVAALADIRRRPASEIKGGKRLWTALAFVNGIGPIAYFALGRKRHEAESEQSPGGHDATGHAGEPPRYLSAMPLQSTGELARPEQAPR